MENKMTDGTEKKYDEIVAKVKFNDAGLVPAIAQDVENNEVLMMAWMNAESLKLTLQTKFCTYWSRSRQELWRKGDTSGDIQIVEDVLVDCDQDTILLLVQQRGKGACHTRKWSCFFRRLTPEGDLKEIDK